MTYLIQILFDRNEPVKYLSGYNSIDTIKEANRYYDKEMANAMAVRFSKERPELIVKVVAER